MQISTDATFAHYMRSIAFALEAMTRHVKVAPKVKRSDNGGCDRFSVGRLSLRILITYEGSEHFVTQAKDWSNLADQVHPVYFWLQKLKLYHSSFRSYYLVTVWWQLGLFSSQQSR